MRRLAVALVLLVGLTPVSASAGAGVPGDGGCVVLTDPAGDTLNAVSSWGFADHPDPEADARVDVRELRMELDGDTLWAVLGIQDLSAPRRPTTMWESYYVSWRLYGQWRSRYVRRSGPVRTFLMGDRETTAVFDEARDEVRIPIPLDTLPKADEDAALTGIHAEASAWEAMLPAVRDLAVLETSEWTYSRFPLDGDCTPESDPGRCLAGTDPHGDAETAGGDPSTDVTGLEVGSDEETLALAVRVADLRPSVSDPAHRQRWSVAWASGGERYGVEAWRDADGYSSALYRTPQGTGFAHSRLEAETDTVLVRVPRSLVGFEGGTELTGLRATARTSVRRGYQDVDVGSDASERFEHVVGEACGPPLPPARCPVVGDPEEDTDPTALGDDAVDLLAAGATSGPDTMRVSVRVTDPTARPPRGFDTAGWTASWSDGERDWYAQAERGPRGLRFRYGTAAHDDGRDEPLGPRFGGRATTGTIDRDTGVVTVDVPRLAVEGLRRFGATSWAMRSAPGAAAYRVFDETDLGTYRTGTSCGA